MGVGRESLYQSTGGWAVALVTEKRENSQIYLFLAGFLFSVGHMTRDKECPGENRLFSGVNLVLLVLYAGKEERMTLVGTALVA